MRLPPLHQLHLGPLDGMDIPPALLALNSAYLKFPDPGTRPSRTVTYERTCFAAHKGYKRKPACWYSWNPNR